MTRLSLSHNRISLIPPSLADLENLEILNLFNNHIEELPTTLSSLPKLRILNLGSVAGSVTNPRNVSSDVTIRGFVCKCNDALLV